MKAVINRIIPFSSVDGPGNPVSYTHLMNQFGYGYCAGAIDANPDVTVQQMNANSFADSATGKSMANAEITNGADIVFQAAGATGLGVIEACQEAGVYAIGVDSDPVSYTHLTALK